MLFNDVETEDDFAPAIQALEERKDISDSASAKKRSRIGLSKDLPRHQVHYRLSEEEKVGAVDTFFNAVKEELDIAPAKARVIECAYNSRSKGSLPQASKLYMRTPLTDDYLLSN